MTMDMPSDAMGVMRDLIDRWYADGKAPVAIPFENVRGEGEVEVAYFLDGMVGAGDPDPDDDDGPTLPADYRRMVEELTGREVGTYHGAAVALYEALPDDAE